MMQLLKIKKATDGFLMQASANERLYIKMPNPKGRKKGSMVTRKYSPITDCCDDCNVRDVMFDFCSSHRTLDQAKDQIKMGRLYLMVLNGEGKEVV